MGGGECAWGLGGGQGKLGRRLGVEVRAAAMASGGGVAVPASARPDGDAVGRGEHQRRRRSGRMRGRHGMVGARGARRARAAPCKNGARL